MEENRTRGGSDGQDREIYQSLEYSQDDGREYGHSRVWFRNKNQKQEEEKRKKKRNKITRYLLGTVSGAALVVSAAAYEPAPVIELTEQEKMFLREVEQGFQADDLDRVLMTLTGRELEYAEDNRIIADLDVGSKMADIYYAIYDKAAWNLEDKLTILMEDEIAVQPDGDGIGFCLDEEKLYYGHLIDGLPDGSGICYEVYHNYYCYSEGGWKEGYANGSIVSVEGYLEGDEENDYVCERLITEGIYENGIAEGTVSVKFEILSNNPEDYDYGDGMTRTATYEVKDGQLVMDERLKKNDSGRYILFDEAGNRYPVEYNVDHGRWMLRVDVEWLPVETDPSDEEESLDETPDEEQQQQSYFSADDIELLEQLADTLESGNHETAASIVGSEEFSALVGKVHRYGNTGVLWNLLPDNNFLVENGADGRGFCLGNGMTQVYFGDLKDGFPDGEGVTLLVYVPTIYEYISGQWQAGLVNGYAENLSVRREDDQLYCHEWSGNFVNGKADGLIRMRQQERVVTSEYDGPIDVTFEYNCSQGEVVKDDYWQESGFHVSATQNTYTVSISQCRTEVAIPRQWQLESLGN